MCRPNRFAKQLNSSKQAFSAKIFEIIQVIYKPNQFAQVMYKPNQFAKRLMFSKQAIQAMKLFKLFRQPNRYARSFSFSKQVFKATKLRNIST